MRYSEQSEIRAFATSECLSVLIYHFHSPFMLHYPRLRLKRPRLHPEIKTNKQCIQFFLFTMIVDYPSTISFKKKFSQTRNGYLLIFFFFTTNTLSLSHIQTLFLLDHLYFHSILPLSCYFLSGMYI